jgi:hypothetical protein
MSSTMMLERTTAGLPGMGMPVGSPMTTPTGMATPANYMMVPRCSI